VNDAARHLEARRIAEALPVPQEAPDLGLEGLVLASVLLEEPVLGADPYHAEVSAARVVEHAISGRGVPLEHAGPDALAALAALIHHDELRPARVRDRRRVD
jgi:hypothetical protein